MPLSSDISTRLTRATGESRDPTGCQTKASARARSGIAAEGGARRSSVCAIRVKTSPWASESVSPLRGFAWDLAPRRVFGADFGFRIGRAFGSAAPLSGALAGPQAAAYLAVRIGGSILSRYGHVTLQLGCRPL